MSDRDQEPVPELPRGIPRAGEVLDGKCRIDGVLGIGGMGVVLAATHLHLQERVAVKIMLPELANDPEVVERFVREGRAAVRIKSPHVAKVLDVATRPSGEPYMIMERLEGRDLGAILEERGSFPLAEAVDYVLEACDALSEAHAKKIVHRDLKPSNLFLARLEDGSDAIKVLDFGISKLVHEEGKGMSITKSRSILGSPLYMSPEQLRASRDVDSRTDVWALGVILFELVAGRPPFEGTTIAEIGALVLAGDAPDLAAVAPSVPPDFAAVVRRCLRRDAGERFASIVELTTALRPFASDHHQGLVDHVARRTTALESSPRLNVVDAPPSSDRAAADVHGAPTVAAGKTDGAWSTGNRSRGLKRSNVVLLVALAAAAVVGMAFVGVRMLDKPRVPVTAGSSPAMSNEPTAPPTLPTAEPPPTGAGSASEPPAPSVAVASASASTSKAPSRPATKTTARPPARPSTAPAPPQPTSDRFQ